MPNSGYAGYANHPWHHYLAGGTASLLELVLPFLVIALFALLVTAGQWGANQAKALFVKHKARADSPDVMLEAHSGSPVLASDRERDEAANRVSQAVGEGRLSIEEGVHRIDAVLRSRHRHELGSLVADLPTLASANITRPLSFAAAQGAPRDRSGRDRRRRASPGSRRVVGAVAPRRGRTRRVDTAASSFNPGAQRGLTSAIAGSSFPIAGQSKVASSRVSKCPLVDFNGSSHSGAPSNTSRDYRGPVTD